MDFDGKLVKLKPEKFEISTDRGQTVKAKREQYPLKVAYGLSVHRAQGLTIPYLVVDSRSFFKPGQFGVAVGRAMTKDRLQVLNYNAEAASMKHPQSVYDFYSKESKDPKENADDCCQVEIDQTEITKLLPQDTEASTENNKQGIIADPEESDTSVAESTQNNEIEKFPWNLPVFLSEIITEQEDTEQQKSLTQTMMDFQKLSFSRQSSFVNLIYNKCVTFYDTNCTRASTKTASWAKLYGCFHKYVTSEPFLTTCKTMWKTDMLTREQNKICSRIMMHCMDKLIEEKAQVISNAQENKMAQNIEDTEDQDLTAIYSAKLRYIIGAAIARIKQRIEKSLISKLNSPRTESIRKYLDLQNKMLASSRVKESEIAATTVVPESLSYIDFKQGPTRGLTYVKDQLFQFSLMLHKLIVPLLSVESFHANIGDMHPLLRAKVRQDPTLLNQWMEIFIDEGVNLEEDIRNELLLDLFNQVTDHFCKIILSEGLHRLKETIPRRKKQALRAAVAGATKKKTGENGSSSENIKRISRKEETGVSSDSSEAEISVGNQNYLGEPKRCSARSHKRKIIKLPGESSTDDECMSAGEGPSDKDDKDAEWHYPSHVNKQSKKKGTGLGKKS